MVQNSKLGYRLSPKSILRLSVFISIVASLLVGSISFYAVKRLQYSGNLDTKVAAKKLPEITTVTALGRLEPKGEIIKLSATVSTQGSRVEQLLIKEGDRVKKSTNHSHFRQSRSPTSSIKRSPRTSQSCPGKPR